MSSAWVDPLLTERFILRQTAYGTFERDIDLDRISVYAEKLEDGSFRTCVVPSNCAYGFVEERFFEDGLEEEDVLEIDHNSFEAALAWLEGYVDTWKKAPIDEGDHEVWLEEGKPMNMHEVGYKW